MCQCAEAVVGRGWRPWSRGQTEMTQTGSRGAAWGQRQRGEAEISRTRTHRWTEK